MTGTSRRISGFTLLELIVTMAIGVILMMVAVPSFTTYKRNAELTSITNTLVASINAARGEAMKRGVNALVVPQDGAAWSSGWYVFVDQNRTQAYDLTADVTLSKQEAPSSFITITGTNNATGSAPYIMFDASGYAKSKASSGGGATGSGNLSLRITRNDLPTASFSEANRIVLVANTGRVRSCKPENSTDSKCKVGTSTTSGN